MNTIRTRIIRLTAASALALSLGALSAGTAQAYWDFPVPCNTVEDGVSPDGNGYWLGARIPS
ncbi:MAG: hypothetical protein ACRD12_22155 [Acidimicrobiales bacterium]